MAAPKTQYADWNQITLEGRLTKDSEYREYQDGAGWCTFSIANNIRAARDNMHTQYFDCEIFGKRSSKLHPKLLRGTHVALTGYVKIRTYQVNGTQRKAVEIVVNEIRPIGKFAATPEKLAGEELVNKLKDDFDAEEFGDETDIPF